MWIYSELGELLNLAHAVSVKYEAGFVYAEMENGHRPMICRGDYLDRVYCALNAGVAVLDLRGEQHG